MTKERYNALMADDGAELDKEEITLGWHFCCEFDGLLVGLGMGELDCCTCWPRNHPVYTAE